MASGTDDYDDDGHGLLTAEPGTDVVVRHTDLDETHRARADEDGICRQLSPPKAAFSEGPYEIVDEFTQAETVGGD